MSPSPSSTGWSFPSAPQVTTTKRLARVAGEALRAVKGEGRAGSARLRKPKELARAGKPEEARIPERGQGQAPARPRPPRRNLRSLPSSPRRPGRGASTKDSNFRAGAGPPPTPGPGRACRPGASCERQAARDERGRPRARRPGAGGLGGGSSEGGGRELLRLPGLPERPKERVSKNRQRPAGGGEEGKRTRNSSPHSSRAARGPHSPAPRSGGSRAARKATARPLSEGERAGGRRRPRPPREEPGAHARQSPPLPPPRLPSAPRPAPLARPAALTEARAPQPRVLLPAATTRARAGRGGEDRPVPAASAPARFSSASSWTDRATKATRTLGPRCCPARAGLSERVGSLNNPPAPGFGKVRSFGAERRAGPGRGLTGGGTEAAGGAAGEELVASTRAEWGVPGADGPDATGEEQVEGGACREEEP